MPSSDNDWEDVSNSNDMIKRFTLPGTMGYIYIVLEHGSTYRWSEGEIRFLQQSASRIVNAFHVPRWSPRDE